MPIRFRTDLVEHPNDRIKIERESMYKKRKTIEIEDERQKALIIEMEYINTEPIK